VKSTSELARAQIEAPGLFVWPEGVYGNSEQAGAKEKTGGWSQEEADCKEEAEGRADGE
jgi:hypothetical protein